MHNDGTRDIGNTQAPVVLLRGVDFAATVFEISEAVKESTGPKCDGLKGARKVMLVRDRLSKASLGFAFVEYINSTVSDFNYLQLRLNLIYSSGGFTSYCSNNVRRTSSVRIQDWLQGNRRILCPPSIFSAPRSATA